MPKTTCITGGNASANGTCFPDGYATRGSPYEAARIKPLPSGVQLGLASHCYRTTVTYHQWISPSSDSPCSGERL
eukprot:1175439-Amphidinium_carterae.1